jgi:hypothetical protein
MDKDTRAVSTETPKNEKSDLLILILVGVFGVVLIIVAQLWTAYSEAVANLAKRSATEPAVKDANERWIADSNGVPHGLENPPAGPKILSEVRPEQTQTVRVSQYTLNELGIALVISCVVGLSIDWSARRRDERQHEQHRQDIETDVFKAVFGFGIHKDVLTEFRETVLVIPFMREKMTLSYKFDPVEDNFTVADSGSTLTSKDLLRVRVTVSYQLRNMSKTERTVPFRHYFENVLHLEDEDSTFVALQTEGARNDIALDGEKIQKRLTREGVRTVLILDDLRVDPKVPPVSIRYTYMTVRRRRDAEIWVSTMAADGFTIQAVVDKEFANLEFCPDASHRLDPSPEGNAKVEGSVYRWEIRSGVLPSQGVILYWRPAAPRTAQSRSDAAGSCQGPLEAATASEPERGARPG